MSKFITLSYGGIYGRDALVLPASIREIVDYISPMPDETKLLLRCRDEVYPIQMIEGSILGIRLILRESGSGVITQEAYELRQLLEQHGDKRLVTVKDRVTGYAATLSSMRIEPRGIIFEYNELTAHNDGPHRPFWIKEII